MGTSVGHRESQATRFRTDALRVALVADMEVVTEQTQRWNPVLKFQVNAT